MSAFEVAMITEGLLTVMLVQGLSSCAFVIALIAAEWLLSMMLQHEFFEITSCCAGEVTFSYDSLSLLQMIILSQK